MVSFMLISWIFEAAGAKITKNILRQRILADAYARRKQHDEEKGMIEWKKGDEEQPKRFGNCAVTFGKSSKVKDVFH